MASLASVPNLCCGECLPHINTTKTATVFWYLNTLPSKEPRFNALKHAQQSALITQNEASNIIRSFRHKPFYLFIYFSVLEFFLPPLFPRFSSLTVYSLPMACLLLSSFPSATRLSSLFYPSSFCLFPPSFNIPPQHILNSLLNLNLKQQAIQYLKKAQWEVNRWLTRHCSLGNRLSLARTVGMFTRLVITGLQNSSFPAGKPNVSQL